MLLLFDHQDHVTLCNYICPRPGYGKLDKVVLIAIFYSTKENCELFRWSDTSLYVLMQCINAHKKCIYQVEIFYVDTKFIQLYVNLSA